MSSPPPEPPRATKWPRWRVTMLIGGLILLAAAVGDAALDDFPRPIYVVVFFAGYVLLAYGFFLAMSARREGQGKKKE